MREIRILTYGGYAIGDSRCREEIESTLKVGGTMGRHC